MAYSFAFGLQQDSTIPARFSDSVISLAVRGAGCLAGMRHAPARAQAGPREQHRVQAPAWLLLGLEGRGERRVWLAEWW